MVLAQDVPQATQSQRIEAQQKYAADVAKYEAELAEYDRQVAAAKTAEARAKEDAEAKKEIEARAKTAATADYKQRRLAYIHTLQRNPEYAQNPSKFNLAVHKWEATQKGISQKEWEAIVLRDIKEHKASQRASAGLRAAGAAEIAAAQKVELARLGATDVTGPTKVSVGISRRVPVAPGVAEKAQDFPEAFQYAKPIPPTVSPAEEFARIATPAAWPEERPYPVTYRPTTVGEMKARVSPYIIPITERGLIGYAPTGEPYVGAPAPKYTVPYRGKEVEFETLAKAEKFAERVGERVVTPVSLTAFAERVTPVPEEVTPELKPYQQRISAVLEGLEEAEAYRPKDPFLAAGYEIALKYPIGMMKSTVAAIASLDVLATQVVAPFITGEKPTARPIPIPITGDIAVFPVAVEDEVRLRGLPEIAEASEKYIRKYGVNAFLGGVVSTYVPIGQAAVIGGTKIARAVSKPLAKVVAPRIVTAVPEKMVKVPMVVTPRKPYISKATLLEEMKAKRIAGIPPIKPSKAVRVDPKYRPVTRPVELDIGTGIIPKEEVVGKIRLTKDFIPGKPTKPVAPARPVEPEIGYRPARRVAEIDYGDIGDPLFRRKTVGLGVGIARPPPRDIGAIGFRGFMRTVETAKPSRRIGLGAGIGRTVRITKAKRTPDYNIAAQQFTDFQKTLEGPRRYTNIVGRIKFSEGFIPSRPSQPFKTYKPKLVAEEPGYTPTKRVGEIDIKDIGDPLFKRKKIELGTAVGERLSAKRIRKDVTKGKVPTPTRKPLKKFDDEFRRDNIGMAGEATVLIQKPEIKAISGKARLRRKPSLAPAPVDWTAKVVEARPPRVGKAPIIITPPAVKKRKKVIPPRPVTTYAETVQREIPKAKTEAVLSTKPLLSNRLRVDVKPAVKSTMKPATVTRVRPREALKEKQRLAQPSPTRPKPKQVMAPRFRPIAPQKLRQMVPEPIPTKRRVVAAIPLPKPERVKKRKKKEEVGVEFVGNVRLHHIEGLIKRETIILGKTKVAKAVKAGKKVKYRKDVRIF